VGRLSATLVDELCPQAAPPVPVAPVGDSREVAGRADVLRGLGLVLALGSLGIPFYLGYFPFDLGVYLRGGAAVTHGVDLYGIRIRQYGFTYPPFPALLAAVPSLLPRWFAAAAMSAASLWALYVIVQRSAPGLARRALRSWLSLLALIACEPSRITLWNGQVNLILAALTIYDLQRPASARGRGVLIGICAGIKLTPGIFVLYLLACRRFRDAGNAAAGFAATVLLGLLIVPTDSREYWTHDLFATSRIGDVARYGDQSLLAVVDRATRDQHFATAVWLVLAVVIAAAGLHLAAQLTAGGEDVLAVAVVGVTGCLVSPVSWTHHWVWIIPLLTGLARRVRSRGGWASSGVLALAALFVIGCNKAPLAQTFHWGAGAWTFGNGYVIAGLVTIALLTADVRRGPVRAVAVPVRTSALDAG
jgi:alpha-1,2-mannosyltransferase